MLPTASKSSMVLSGCTHWIDKPAFVDQFADTTKRDIGTVFHTGAELLLHGKALPDVVDGCRRQLRTMWKGDLARLPDANQIVSRMLLAAREYLAGALDTRWSLLGTEVAVSLNLMTGERAILDVSDRGYPGEPDTLYGTADIVGLNKYGLFIADWKSGVTDSARDQMMTLAAIIAPPGEGATICTLALREERSGYAVSDWDEYVSAEELTEHIARVSEAVSRGPTQPNPGAHCVAMYCPYLYNCQVTNRAIEEFAGDDKAPKDR